MAKLSFDPLMKKLFSPVQANICNKEGVARKCQEGKWNGLKGD